MHCLVQPSEKKIEESKLVLEGLVQHYKLVGESDKSKVLVDLLDNLEFNQVRLSLSAVHGGLSPASPVLAAKLLRCAASCWMCCRL